MSTALDAGLPNPGRGGRTAPRKLTHLLDFAKARLVLKQGAGHGGITKVEDVRANNLSVSAIEMTGIASSIT